jgi:cyclase
MRTRVGNGSALGLALGLAVSVAAGVTVLGQAAGGPSPAQGQPAPARPQPNFDSVEEKVLHVQGNVYMVVGAGGNTTLQIGDDGVLVVDTQLAQVAPKLLAKIKELTNKPIRYVVNTHVHPDHVGGNEIIAKAGVTIAGGNVVGNIGASAGEGAAVIAHENVLTRMSAPTGTTSPFPFSAWPTDTFVHGQKELFFNGEAVMTIHQPDAHTDGDSIVYFRKSDVISAGDLFVMNGYPFIDAARGGHINGIIQALNNMLDIAIPKEKQEGGTMIVPGHGRLTDEADLLEYRDMITIIRDRIQDLVNKGQTLEQVQAAKPTQDYDGRFGSTTGFNTTTQFVEAIYKDLSQGKKTESAK